MDVADLCPTGDKLGTGHYVAEFTPGLTDPIGTWELRWFFKLTASSPEQTFKEEFEVLAEVTGSGVSGYATVQSMRDEGIPATLVSDARMQEILARVSSFIDCVTGRSFAPKAKTIKLDGNGGRALLLHEPIIAISNVVLDSSPFSPSDLPIYSDLYRVYNRHLTQCLFHPDDRENPKIEFFHTSTDVLQTRAGISFTRLIWPVGQQNVTITGIFGYTDPDGSTTGRTPLLIARAAQLLAMREIYTLAEFDKREDVQKRWRLLSERTRDQSYTLMGAGSLGNRGSIVGSITGDPEIDTILVKFRRPPLFGSA